MDRITLIKNCQQGDLGSFEQLYRIYAKNAMGTAYLIAKNKETAEDIVQESFFQCYKKIGSLKDVNTFDVWFYKLLVRLAWRMSSKYKEETHFGRVDDKAAFDNGDLKTEDDLGENRLIVHEAIENLSPPLKSVVILYYFNGMTIKQISLVLGCFQGTVKSRLHNAKKFLKKELSESSGKETYKTMYVKE